LLLLGAAAAWRWRSTVARPAIAVASVVVAKLILWPLAVWLALTRRFRALGFAVLLPLTGTIAAWAVIGFAGLTAYPHLLASDAYKDEGRGFSLVSALLSLGFPVGPARALALSLAVALLFAAWLLVRRPDGDARAFGLAVMAALIATPVLWDHYLVLLFAPIALLAPRLSLIWFLPMLAGVARVPVTHASIWHSVVDLAIEAIVIGLLSRPILRRSMAPELVPVATGPLAALENRA
jgi:alpha-1,2-mannosyltransferase